MSSDGTRGWALVAKEERKRGFNGMGQDPNKLGLFCSKPVPQLIALELSLSLVLPGIIIKRLRHS